MTENEKLDLILQKISSLDEKVDRLEEKFDDLDKRASSLESNMKEVQHRATQANLIIQNEIRDSIQRIAKGHYDLSKILSDVIKSSYEVELLSVKVRMLETDVCRLRER